MPTENERKFVLRLCEAEIARLADDKLQITQGYLTASKGMSLRIRQTVGKKPMMTFKQKANGRVVEIEKKISKRDFDDLWCYAWNKLEKLRYNISVGDLLWEVDFFKDHLYETYFVVAEVELPEGVSQPSHIPDFILDNLLFAVPDSDDRFSSKRIAGVRYARNLLKRLLKENTVIA